MLFRNFELNICMHNKIRHMHQCIQSIAVIVLFSHITFYRLFSYTLLMMKSYKRQFV